MLAHSQAYVKRCCSQLPGDFDGRRPTTLHEMGAPVRFKDILLKQLG